MRAGFAVVLVTLAVPAAALGFNHHGSRHHGHRFAHQGATGSSSVTSYSDGTLVLAASNGTSITGSVTQDTHFQCVGAGWRDGGWRRGRRFGRRNGPLDSSGASGPTGSSGSTGATGTTGASGPAGGGGNSGGNSGGGSTGGDGWGGGGATGGRGWGGTQPGYGHGRGDQGGGWGHDRWGHGHGRGRGDGSGGSDGASSSGNSIAPPPCDSSLLVAGAMVSSAEVLITPAGVEFGAIVLLPAVQ
jgi:hypothetical protein